MSTHTNIEVGELILFAFLYRGEVCIFLERETQKAVTSVSLLSEGTNSKRNFGADPPWERWAPTWKSASVIAMTASSPARSLHKSAMDTSALAFNSRACALES